MYVDQSLRDHQRSVQVAAAAAMPKNSKLNVVIFRHTTIYKLTERRLNYKYYSIFYETIAPIEDVGVSYHNSFTLVQKN